MTVEPKPPWRRVPASVRRQTETVLGAAVRRAVRLWGGYAPSATFRLFLADGRRVVFKGIGGTTTAGEGFSKEERERQEALIRRILADEERTYRELAPLIRPWAPELLGSFEEGDWRVLVLEDVGPAQVPPWTDDLASAALTSYAAFHAASLGRTDVPEWVRRDRHHRFGRTWSRLAGEAGGLESLARLAGERADEARRWLEQHLEPVKTTADQLEQAPEPHALLHFDTRSDNLRVQAGGRLRLFDWPFASVGPHEFDVAAFVQSIATEGGPEPEQCMGWYAEHIAVHNEVLDAAVAGVAGYFAESSWRPPVPGLPRLRGVQRRQLKTSLAWCAQRLGLPPPTWLAAVPD